MKTAGAILDGHAWQTNWGTSLATVLPGGAANIGFNRFVLAPQYDCATITSTSITSTNAPADADIITLVRAALAAGQTIGLKPLVRPNDGDIQGHLTGGGYVAKNNASYTGGSTAMILPGGSFSSADIGRRVVTPTPGHYEEIPSGLSSNAYGLATPTFTTITAASGTSITLSAAASVSSGTGYVVVTDDTAAATWFANYQTILDHLIGLVVNPVGSGGAGCPAARLTVDISTEHDFLHVLHDSKWRALVTHLRTTWPGVILTAGAPAVNGYNLVRCWDVLDLIGVTWYRQIQTLAGGEPLATIETNTSNYLSGLSSLSAAWGGKQILFTELGFRSIDAGVGSQPAGYQPSASSGGTAGETSQAQCVRAFLDTIWQQSWFAGFHWWAWQYPQSASPTGEASSFSVTNADGSLKAAAREFKATLSAASAARVLAATVDGGSFVPAALMTDLAGVREFNGPYDPSQIDGVLLSIGDRWNKSTLPPAPPPPPPPNVYVPRTLTFDTYRPDDTNTGIVTPLAAHAQYNYPGTSPIVITQAGTRLTSLDVYGDIIIQAANVIIEDCILRGPRNWPTNDGAIVDCNSSLCQNALIRDCTVAPQLPNFYRNAVIGHEYKWYRNRSFWVNDHCGMYTRKGTGLACNVEVAGSYGTDNVYWQGTTAQYIGQAVGTFSVTTTWGATFTQPGYPLKADGTHNDFAQCQGALGGTKSVWIHGNHGRVNDAEQLVPLGQSDPTKHPVGWADVWPQLGTQNCHKRRTYAGTAGTNPSSPIRLPDGRYPSNGQTCVVQQNTEQFPQVDTVVVENNWFDDYGTAGNLQALAGGYSTMQCTFRNNHIGENAYNYSSAATPAIYPLRIDNRAGATIVGLNTNIWWGTGPYGVDGAALTEGRASGIVYDS